MEEETMEPESRITHLDIKVRSWTLDMYNQVSNAKFLEFLDEARFNHFQGFFDSGNMLSEGLALLLVNVNLDYRSGAHLGDTLEIETYVERIGEKSLTLRHTIFQKTSREVVVEGAMTFVIKNLKKGHAVPISGRLMNMLLKGHA
jgi:thioesterase-3